MNSIHEEIEDDMDASYDDEKRIRKRKGTYDMMEQGRERLDHHTNNFNPPLAFEVDDLSEEEDEQYGDPFARTKKDMSKQLNIGLDLPSKKKPDRLRDRSPLFDDSIEISRRPSARRSATRTTDNDSLYDSGANGTTEDYYSRLRADMQKTLNTDFILPPDSDRSTFTDSCVLGAPYWFRKLDTNHRSVLENVLIGETKMTHKLMNRVMNITNESHRSVQNFLRWWFDERQVTSPKNNHQFSPDERNNREHVECPFWWRDLGQNHKSVVENVLRGEKKITQRLIIRIVKITNERERNVEHFLRWWFHVYLPDQKKGTNHLGVQKYDNVWRTRSAQPVYGHHHGGDGNEDYYGRTKNELRKNINTNLNISKIADNRILRINIDQHHENNELTENYEKSHLDKIFVKNRNRIVRSVPPNRTERDDEHFGNPFARTQNDMKRILNSKLDPHRRRSPSYKHHRRFDFQTEEHTKRSVDRAGRRKRPKEDELKPYTHRKKIRKDHLIDSEEDELDVLSEKDYEIDFRRRLLRDDSKERVGRALHRSKEHVQNYRTNLGGSRASQLKKSINNTLENIASLRNRNPYEDQNEYLPDKHTSALPRRQRPHGFLSDGEVEDRRFDFDDHPPNAMSETNASSFIKTLAGRRRPGNTSALPGLINRNSNSKRAREANHLAHLLRQYQADSALQDKINSQLFDMIDIDEFPLHIVE